MQTINRIQNVTINANATILGATVVVEANAHRAYPSLKPCDPSFNLRGSDSGTWSSKPKAVQHSQKCLPEFRSGSDLVGNYEASLMWRLPSRDMSMPANIATAPVFHRALRD